MFIKDEKFSIYKIIGALVGFCGIIAINYSAGGDIKFTIGDYLIIAASFCTVVASILTKKVAQKNSSFWVVGISQLTGGILLFIIGIVLGGRLPKFSTKAIFVFAYICIASIVGYCLWTYLQKNGDLSKLFIIKFAEPLFACIFGAILLGEDILKLQYLIAFILISVGIVLGNKSEVKVNERTNI
ncbi:MAG: DMT family transporter [bacterium]|nr:DMT family transporter [bacterium]